MTLTLADWVNKWTGPVGYPTGCSSTGFQNFWTLLCLSAKIVSQSAVIPSCVDDLLISNERQAIASGRRFSWVLFFQRPRWRAFGADSLGGVREEVLWSSSWVGEPLCVSGLSSVVKAEPERDPARSQCRYSVSRVPTCLWCPGGAGALALLSLLLLSCTHHTWEPGRNGLPAAPTTVGGPGAQACWGGRGNGGAELQDQDRSLGEGKSRSDGSIWLSRARGCRGMRLKGRRLSSACLSWWRWTTFSGPFWIFAVETM